MTGSVIKSESGVGAVPPAPAPARSSIPQTFHFIWFDRLPDHLAEYVDTWVDRHPNWTFKRWGGRELPTDLCNQDLFDRAEEIAPGSEYQFMSDIWRYEILAREGGVYVDCDMECRQAIDPLFNPGISCFAAWELRDVWINNAFMGAAPRHPAVDTLVRYLPNSVKANPGERPNVLSGPQMLTFQWKRPSSPGYRDDVKIFPQSWFYPYAYDELDRQGEDFGPGYAIHHWNNQRVKHGA